MSKIIIGCDPDSNESGFSFYVDGKLEKLVNMSLIEFYNSLLDIPCHHNIELHIENVNGNSSNAFHVKSKDPLPVKLKKAEHIGKCKQVQIEVERIASIFDIKIVHHKVSKMWKDQTGKQAFEQLTGWKGRSNEDTRSAAYFGFLGCK